jgi:hypothetical protein
MVKEHAVAVWLLALVAEELRQMFDAGWEYVYFRQWYQDTWNKMDVLMYSAFFTTYLCRVTDTYFQDQLSARGMYGAIALLVWMRSLNYFIAFESLGR